MPVYRFDDLRKDFVTPKHSTAFGSLVTGKQVEVGWLRYRAPSKSRSDYYWMNRGVMNWAPKCVGWKAAAKFKLIY